MSDEQTIENLNKALQMEMSGAHQYQLHAHVLEDWGLTKLAQQMRKEMQEELGHSDRFVERIGEQAYSAKLVTFEEGEDA